jgi:hypothetical protein
MVNASLLWMGFAESGGIKTYARGVTGHLLRPLLPHQVWGFPRTRSWGGSTATSGYGSMT